MTTEYNKYIKYKTKYLDLKKKTSYNFVGGGIETGKTLYFSPSENNNLRIDMDNKTKVTLQVKNDDTPNQRFYKIKNNDENFKIKNVQHKKCLDRGFSNIWGVDCKTEDNQDFTYEKIKDKTYIIQSKNKEKCLEYKGENDMLTMKTCDKNNKNQQYDIKLKTLYKDSDVIKFNELRLLKIKRELMFTRSTYKEYLYLLNQSNLDGIHISAKQGNENKLLIFFSWLYGDFDYAGTLDSFPSEIIIFRDRKKNTWYLNIMSSINDYIKNYIYNKDIELTFMGLSMGAYAAIYISKYFPNSVCIAFSPQTYSNTNMNIYKHESINTDNIKIKKTPENLPFLRDHLINTTNKIYIYVGISECVNINNIPECNKPLKDFKDYWNDLSSVGTLIGLQNVNIILIEAHTHGTHGIVSIKCKDDQDLNTICNIVTNNFRELQGENGIDLMKKVKTNQ